MEFDGKVAIVTGGANGIGNAVCRQFAERGARVLIVDRDEASGELLAADIGKNAKFCRADVGDSNDVRRYVSTALEFFGAIDFFHNNAAIQGDIAVTAEYDEEVFDRVINVNLKGVFLGLRHVLPVMITQGRGSIVNTASVAGMIGSNGMAAYVASKHAVIGLTKVAAGEAGPYGVRVNAICPGPTSTGMSRDAAITVSPEDPDDVERRFAASIPIRRYGRPEEVAHLVLFLCSDLAGNITGAQYAIDGGRTAAPAGIAT